MAPVIFEMDVHCLRCAKKIHKAIKKHLGVEKVSASPETGLVVVTGTADAAALRRCIERKMRRSVTILSGGTVPVPWRMTHLAPLPPPAGYSSSYGWGMAPPPHPAGYPYTGNHWAPWY